MTRTSVGPLNPSIGVLERFRDMYVEDFGRLPQTKDELLKYMQEALDSILSEMKS